MFLLEYLFFLGIAYIVFWLVNWVIGLLGTLLFMLIRFRKGMYIIKALLHYILVSLFALLTLASMQMNPSTVSVIVLALVGVFIVFMLLSQNAYEKKRQAILDYDYELMENLKYDGLFVIGFTVLFIVMLFIPSIAQNTLTMRLLALTDWAYELKIIGWILRIGGAIFMLGIAFQGISLSLILIGSVISKLTRREGKPMEKIITDNTSERIIVRWDGTRFALVSKRKDSDTPSSTIILNPKAMLDLITFAGSLESQTKG